MRSTDKPERMAALGAPTNRQPLLGDADATRRSLFETGDHQPDGMVLRLEYKADLRGIDARYRADMLSGRLERFALGVLTKLKQSPTLEWMERLSEAIAQPTKRADSVQERALIKCAAQHPDLIVHGYPDYASMTDEAILAWPDEVLLPSWFGVDKAKLGSDDCTVLFISTPTGEGGQFYQQACMRALEDNMRTAAGPCHLPALDMEPADDTPHEEARNLLDDLLVDSADVSVEAMNIISLMVHTAILDACSDEPALLRTLELSYTTVNMVNNVMLRLLGFRPCGAGMVDETVAGAYHPARLQEQRLITDPTDEVLHGQVRPERDRQSPQDHGSTGAGGGSVGAISQTIAGARGFLRPDHFHDRPGPEASGGHALRAAEAADGRVQRQCGEAERVAPAVGSAEWLRSAEGHKFMQVLAGLTPEQQHLLREEGARRASF